MNFVSRYSVTLLTRSLGVAAAVFLLLSCSDDKKPKVAYDIISFEESEGMLDLRGDRAELRNVVIEGAFAGGSFRDVLCGKEYIDRENADGNYFDDVLFTTADGKVAFGAYYNDMSNNPYGAYDTWGGFALSKNYSQTPTADGSADFTGSHFSAWTKTGANRTSTFALAYVNDYGDYEYNTPKISFSVARQVAHLYMANATLVGQWESSRDDYWFKVTITGYRDGNKGPSVEQVLISGKTIISDWVKVNCSSLGSVDELRFEVSSNDMSGTYLNCPSYFCIDEIALVKYNRPLLTNNKLPV